MITKTLMIGITQLCAVTEIPHECTDWMLECVPLEIAEVEVPTQQQLPPFVEDNILEVCIELYEGALWEAN